MDKTYNILLVDDEPGVRESVQAYLDDEDNLSVTAAESATKALELLQTFTPDLVISDIMMPQMSGYDFLEKLREDPRFKTLPVVFLTARGMTSDRIQGYQAGCDAYLPKPFEPEELEAIVKNLLTKEEAIAENQGSSDANLDGIAKDLKEIKQFLGQQNQMVTTPPPLKIDLTPREQSVLDLVAQGLMNKEIAKQLETSVRNVEKYVSRLFGKTGTNSRTELVRYALKHGLTQ